MATIPTSLLRSQYTNQFIALWKEEIRPTTFLSNFIRDGIPTTSRYVSIETQRGTTKLASAVVRGTGANLNTFERSTQKTFDPPAFAEKFTIGALEVFNRAMGSNSIDSAMWPQIQQEALRRMRITADKIVRTGELMRAQALLTGVVTLTGGGGVSIDYGRRSELVIAYDAANNFADDTKNPSTILASFSTLMKKYGRIGGGTIDIIMGTTAAAAFLNNAIVKGRADIRRIELESIQMPQYNQEGASYLGMYSDGINIYRLWTYEQYYTDANGVDQQYIDPKKIIMIPPGTEFTMEYAGVEQLIDNENPTMVAGKFIYNSYTDMEKQTKVFEVRQASLPVLVTVDKLLTAQVIA